MVQDSREPKISETDVPTFIDQNVLGLQISVNDALRVQIAQSEGNLSRIELDS